MDINTLQEGMKRIISDLVKLFAPSSNIDIKIHETIDGFSATVVSSLVSAPVLEDLVRCMSFKTGDSDMVFFQISSLDDEECILLVEKEKKCQNIPDLDIFYGLDVEFKLTIQKSVTTSIISVYDIDSFVSNIEELDLKTFLELLDRSFDKCLRLECLHDEFSLITETMIVSDNISTQFSEFGDERTRRVESRQVNTTWGKFKTNLFPSDFKPRSFTESRLSRLFNKISGVLSVMTLCDCAEFIDDRLEFKLYGYKGLSGSIVVNKLGDLSLDEDSIDLWNEISQWCYSGGSLIDKLGIVRNIISLNIDFSTLKLEPSTFIAIKSNFKIFEKENVKEYIELRNSVSEMLLDMQAKSSEIVSSYTGQFKQNLVALLSFFVSVIVLNVITSGDLESCFTPPILYIMVTFILISRLLLEYYKWEVNKQFERYVRQYHQLENRYRDLFSEEECQEIFKDANIKNKDSNVAFVKKQINVYTHVWRYSLMLLFLLVIILWIFNVLR